MVDQDDHLQEASPSGRSFAGGQSLWMILCKRRVHSDDHLQEAGPFELSFARGSSLWVGGGGSFAVNPDDHLQEASPSGWSFAKGRSIRMIIYKRRVHSDDHLQEAGPTGWSFARGQSIRMIICRRPDPLDDHLQCMIFLLYTGTTLIIFNPKIRKTQKYGTFLYYCQRHNTQEGVYVNPLHENK